MNIDTEINTAKPSVLKQEVRVLLARHRDLCQLRLEVSGELKTIEARLRATHHTPAR